MRCSFLFALVLAAGCSKPAPQAPVAEPTAVVAPAAPDPRIALAAKRAVVLDRLHDYWVAGEFPLDDSGLPESVFRDRAGRECPMAAMISQSGNEHLVAAVVEKNNRLQLADIHDGPLMDWILDSGLTKDEVVKIQGILQIDLGQFPVAVEQPSILAAATHREVRARIRKTEGELRANTPHSLDVAAAAIPAGPRVASTAPVVPKALEAPPAPRFVVRSVYDHPNKN